MDANCKNNKFNLDHVYCHSNDGNYIRTTKSTGAVDIISLLKENKQLKAMLLLHLDLIQEQSDQLQAKDKLLSTLKEENESLKLKIDNLEDEKNCNKIGLATVHDNNYKCNITTGGRNSYHRVHGKVVESSDVYKKNIKIQNIKHEDKKENLADYSNTEQQIKNSGTDKTSSFTTATITTRSRHTPTPPSGQINNETKKLAKNINNNVLNSGSIIGQSNGKPISKIMLHRVKIPDNILPSKVSNSDEKIDTEISSFNMQLSSIFENKSHSLVQASSRSPKWFRKTNSPPNLSLTAPLNKKSRIHKNNDNKLDNSESPLSPLLEPKSEILVKDEIKHEDTDDGFSCGSSGPDMTFDLVKSSSNIKNIQPLSEIQFSKSQTLFSKINTQNSVNANSQSSSSSTKHSTAVSKPLQNNNQLTNFGNNNLSNRKTVSESGRKKITYLTTRKIYSAREWITEGLPAEEFTSIKEEEEALKAEQPMLEIPKWSLKEVACLYSIEGTEDLSDETFRKRHAKLEYEEKRRKKWDVQRIREQRTIERLKRRHCKEELVETENQEFISFYPPPEQIKFIQISDELPVEAFGGELIPRLSPSEFQLPWKKHSYLSRTNEISNASNIEYQPDSNQHIQKSQHHHSRNQNYNNDNLLMGYNNVLPNNTCNSSFLFIKKRKKPQTANTKKHPTKNSNSTQINTNTSNTSSNIISSLSSKSTLAGNITTSTRYSEDKISLASTLDRSELLSQSPNTKNENFNI